MTMTDIDEILANHRVIYFPWAENDDEDPVAFTIELAKYLGLPITVVAVGKQNIPDELSSAGYVTERSSRASNQPSVTLLYYPTKKLMSAMPRTGRVVAAEFFMDPLRTWAAKRGAWNIHTGETMALELAPKVEELYSRILWNGNNGWFDKPGQRDALRDLRELKDMGALDKEQLLGYLIGEKSHRSLEQLAKLVDQVASQQ